MTGFAQKLLLLGGCCCLAVLLLVGPAMAQADDDAFEDRPSHHAKSDESAEGNNATLRCWYCLSRFRTWDDCQYNNEVDFCEPDPATGLVSCVRSAVLYQRATGDSKTYRYAGCALNRTALQDVLYESFEVSFNQTSATSNTTLVLFETCSGALCNVMSEEAQRRGSTRLVKLNVMNPNAAVASGPVAGLIAALAVAVFARQ